MKKLLAMILMMALALSTFVGCNKDNKPTPGPDSSADGGEVVDPNQGKLNNNFKVGGTAIVGSATELGGDFRWPGVGGSSAGAADQDIAFLTAGYATMELDATGAYQWNNTVVKSHTEEEIAAGDATNFKVTIELNEGLTFSDGSPVKADNYLAYAMAMSTPVSKEGLDYDTAGQAYAGYKAYNLYDGTNDNTEVKTAEGKVIGTAHKEFAGFRKYNDYKFSMEIDGAAGFYPYYFAFNYGAVGPEYLGLLFGTKNVTVKDDGNGCYLDGDFYVKADDSYDLAAHLKKSRFDTTSPYSGPYTIEKWDVSKKEVTLKINPKYKGNFEGQLPHVEKIIMRKIIEETQNAQLSTGEIDVLDALTGGDAVNGALKVIQDNPGKFAQVHYDRAGYGKIQFECDFGPTMFPEVRQAVAYSFDRDSFANTFCGGYGAVVHGPYSPNFAMYAANEELIDNLNTYAPNPANAKKALADGGWVYNSKGQAYVEGQSGVDSVRYKKLSADEYGVDDVNKTYKSVKNEDGIEYKTVKVGDDYYMPLVINWFASTPNPVSDQLVTALKEAPALKEIGMVIRQETGDFTKLLGEIYRDASFGYVGTPNYGMFNLATGWNAATYDYAFNWVSKYDSEYDTYFGYSSNKLSDPYDKDFRYEDHKGLTYDEAMEQSGGKLGMNYLSMAMVYSVKPGNEAEYNKIWGAYIKRWNELLPDIPLYSNVYYDVYNSKILNYKTSPFRSSAKSLLYCAIKDAQ